MRRSPQSPHQIPGASRAFLPCCSAFVAPDPYLYRRACPPSPCVDRFAVAEAEPRPAGPAGLGPLAEGRAVRAGRSRFRGRNRDRVAVCDRDRRPAGGPRPEAAQAVRAAKKAGYPFAVLDGTLIRTDRVAADRPFFSGKHHCHGMNLQVIASPAGQLTWVSGALPGSVHDIKAAWIWGIERELAAAGLPTRAEAKSGDAVSDLVVRGRVRGVACGTNVAYAVLMVVLTPDRHPPKATSAYVILSDTAPGGTTAWRGEPGRSAQAGS